MKFELNTFTVSIGGLILLFGTILIFALSQPAPRLVDSCGGFEAQRLEPRTGGGLSGVIAKYFVNQHRESSNQEASIRHSAMDSTFFNEQLTVAKLKLKEAQEDEEIWQEKNPLNTALIRLDALRRDPYYRDRLLKMFNEEVKEYKQTSETYQRKKAEYIKLQQYREARWIREKSEYESQIERHRSGVPTSTKTIISLETILGFIAEKNLAAAKTYITACSRG